MTLPSSNSQVVYTGNGLTTNFPFTFIVPTDSMQVSLYNTVTFTEDVLDPSVYTVNGYDAPAGGSVDYPLVGSPIAATLKLIITRVVPAVQELDLTGQSNWQPENLEEQLDLIVMMVQQLNTGLALAVTQSAATATGDPLTFNDVLEAAQAAATSASAAATSASGAAASAVTAAAQAAAAAASAATAVAAIAPIITRGDLLTRSATVPIRLAIGGANTFLGSDGTDPAWKSAAQVKTSLGFQTVSTDNRLVRNDGLVGGLQGTGITVDDVDAVTGLTALSISSTAAGIISSITSTDAGVTAGPVYDIYRDSVSPAVSDILGQVVFNGRDSAGNKQEYFSIQGVIADPTSTSEDSSGDFYAQIAGARTKIVSMGPSFVGLGTQTNDSAAAGFIGELISSTVLVGAGVSLTSTAATNVTSISLTAGDWDVWGNVCFTPNAATTIQGLIAWISITSATNPTVPNEGAVTTFSLPFSTGANQIIQAGQKRISLASTTTVYLSTLAVFGVSTMVAFGYIGARRVR